MFNLRAVMACHKKNRGFGPLGVLGNRTDSSHPREDVVRQNNIDGITLSQPNTILSGSRALHAVSQLFELGNALNELTGIIFN